MAKKSAATEAASLMGKRGYKARLERFGIERLQEIARNTRSSCVSSRRSSCLCIGDDRPPLLAVLLQLFLPSALRAPTEFPIFPEHALRHVVRLLGDRMAVDLNDRAVVKYQTDRLKEAAAPKTINDEVGFLLRILPVAQAGAIRAQLRKQKQLKLKGGKRVGKAYSMDT